MIPKIFIREEIKTTKLELSNKSIYENLVAASENKMLLSIREGQQRVIGKTTALINFAKDNGYTVLVGSNVIAKMHVGYFGYPDIRSINSRGLDGLGGIVVDECCPLESIQKLINEGHLVVTGFVK